MDQPRGLWGWPVPFGEAFKQAPPRLPVEFIERNIKLTHMEAVVALDKHMDDLHCTLWGESYTITNKERREAAIDWFIGTCEAMGLLIPHETHTKGESQ